MTKNNIDIVVDLKDILIYQQDELILRNVNLRIASGEFIYLIGKTGSGKSSLLKTLYAALPLANGAGRVASFDLRKLSRKTIPLLRRKLGVVFQDFNLLMDRNVEENLRFVLKATGWKKRNLINDRINEVLEQVDLLSSITKMPHKLSGGEQQRIVFARALLNKPALIIADEPTGNLDPETSDDILLLLRKLNKEQQTAVIFATHDYRLLQNFPGRILRCHRGQLLDEENIVI